VKNNTKSPTGCPKNVRWDATGTWLDAGVAALIVRASVGRARSEHKSGAVVIG
jgi:hypothetical protein